MKDKLDLGDLEVNILKLMQNDRSFLLKMLKSIKRDYFESEINSKVFEIYNTIFNRLNKTPTKEIISQILSKKGISKDMYSVILDRVFNTNPLDPAEKEYITEEVISFAKRARMKEAIIQSIDHLEKDEFETINTKVKEALMFNLDINVGYDLFDIDERYLNLATSHDNKITTGFPQFDKALDGGFARKELYSFMGPPGIGKSIFLPNCGFKALINGMNVVHYSLEMSEDRIGMRYDAIASGITMNILGDNKDEVVEAYNKVKMVTKTHLKIKEFPTGMASVLDIESHLEQLKLHDDFEPDIIFVDYGDIMRSMHKSANTYEEQGWVFRELRGLAVKKNIAVITATQANRDSMSSTGAGTKEIIGMGNTADSMEKNRILDGLFSIVQSQKEKEDGSINLYMAKNRNGAANIYINFLINYNTMTIKDPSTGSFKKNETEEE